MQLTTSLKKLALKKVNPEMPTKLKETMYDGRTINPEIEPPHIRLKKYARRELSILST